MNEIGYGHVPSTPLLVLWCVPTADMVLCPQLLAGIRCSLLGFRLACQGFRHSKYSFYEFVFIFFKFHSFGKMGEE